MRLLKKWLCLETTGIDDKRAKKTTSTSLIKQNLVKQFIVKNESKYAASYDDAAVDAKNCRLLLNASNLLEKRKASSGASSTTDDAETSSCTGTTASVKSGTSGEPRRSRKCVTFLMVFGLINLLLGVLSLIWTPFNLFMNERLRMMPGLPPFEWWRQPPDEVLMRVYIFNITNSVEFLAGADSKLRYEEIGPFVFLEKLVHKNITFHPDDTMTYVAHRTAIFLPELTSISLNATIIVPNLAVLGMASKMYDASFFTKFGFNMLVNSHKSKPLLSVTIDDYFWNFTDPIIATGKKLLPFMVPTDNMAILKRIYSDFNDEVTVYIGVANAKRFFTIKEFHGSPRLNHWPDEQCDQVAGGSEGVTYHQFIQRNETLNYFRKTICRMTPVHYVGDVVKHGLDVFRFELPASTYRRPEDPEEEDCFSRPGLPVLPSGVSDVSPCYFGFPIASSMPHFLYGDAALTDGVQGMKPDKEKHESYVIVEPTTGVPMESRARSQSNLVMRHLTGFNHLNKFSDVVMPMFWIEYNQVGLPWYVLYLMYFTVKVLPTLQTWISAAQLVFGTGMLAAVTILHIRWRRRRSLPAYAYSSLERIPSTTSSDC